MSNVEQETQQVIDKLRAQRGAPAATRSGYVRYRRMTRPWLARLVHYGYVFLAGMLFASLLHGYKTGLLLILIVVVFLYSVFRE